MRLGDMEFRKTPDQPVPNTGLLWPRRAIPAILLLAPSLVLGGCAGLVSGNTNSTSPTTLVVSNVQTSAITTSGSQVSWTTDAPADSSVDYGTTATFGTTTPVNSTMVTSHQITLSGLAAGTTYYIQVNSTDAKGHHGHGGNSFNTAGFSVSGTISPSTGGTGATVTLSGTRSATTTSDNFGTYTFSGLPSGSYGVKPSRQGYTFSPASQTVSVGSANVAAVNFSASASVVAPTITTQPVSQTVTAGQTATFSVVAGGTAPLSYQWQKNGANIAGAIGASYTTPATATTDSGSTFGVVVSNSAGSVTSSAATLTVTAGPVAPTISTQPTNQTVTAGQTATFSVVASGTAPLSYQWQKNGANIAGATGATYTTPVTATTDSGSTFDVAVSNSAGSVTSAIATLTVNAATVAPTITTQPVSQTVTAGQTATFTVVAGGTAPLNYQWQKNGANIAGATGAGYTTPVTATTDSGSTFDVVVTNAAGTATSAAATLTVTAAAVAPTITTQPVSQTVTAGQTATFRVVAGGTAPLSYQWQKNGANIAGATGASYTTPVTATTDSGSTFDVAVSNSAGSVTSTAAALTVTAAAVAPTIATQPVSQTVTAGQTATFSVVANGTAPLSYQWQKNGANIAGATSSSYTTPATATTDSGSTFDVVVSNSAGNATSSTATLTVTAGPVAPTITTQPTNQTVTAGQTATFSVVASGTAPLSYQWQKNGANIAGATGANYTTPVTATTDSGSTFDVAVSNSAGSVTSATATLTVNAAAVAPTITTQPVSQTVTAGQTATFTVVAGGTAPLNYQWQKNGANIAGATGAGYTTPVTAATDSGSTFDVVVSNSAGSVTSTAATLTVTAAAVAPTITTQPVSQTVTAGQTATFSVVAGGTAPLSYQWQKNGANIAGATGASYTTPVTATTDSGSTFDVVVSNSAGSVTSATATLTVNPAPAPAIQLSSTSINFGNDVVGVTTSIPLVITNTGTATLNITQITSSGAAFSLSGFTLPLSVNPGSQTSITVAFLPTTTGATSGSVSILSNAPTSPNSVSLAGAGIAPTLTLGIGPGTLSFGNVTTGTSSAAQGVTITNTGNSNVTISQIALSGAGYSMTGGSAPVTLSPTQNVVLAITFSPTATGTVNGSISIVSNASGSPAAVSLSGTGVAPVQHSVALSWTASTSTVSGYNVYRGTVSGGPYTKINTSLITTLSYADSTVISGTTYYYVATAVDSSGNESVNSNGVSAAIP